jgi:ankyrin repeat protein
MSYLIKLDKERLQAFIQSPLYRKDIDYSSLLFDAIESKDYDTITLLAPLTDCFDKNGNSLLHEICKADNINISDKGKLLRTLLSNGLNPQICDRNGNTALHITDDREIIQLVLEFGMNPYLRNKNGNTAKECYLRRNYPPGSEIGGWADQRIIELYERYENLTLTKRAK